MKLLKDDLESLHQVAILAAVGAGRLIFDYASKVVAVQHKSGGSSPASQVVTEVDLLSEAAIIERLQPTCDEYDIALLSEEREDDGSRLEKDYFWSIDPLDGTLAFINSIPGYAVSIALVSRTGIPLIGVVYDPVTDTCYSAVHGVGARRNGEAWAPSVNAPMEGKVLTLVCDRGLSQRNEYPEVRQTIATLSDKLGLSGLKTIDNEAGAVINACRVIENSPACYLKLPKKATGGGCLWDFAATTAIFSELNAIATDCYGQPLALNRAESLYMNDRGVLFATHAQLARQLTDHLC